MKKILLGLLCLSVIFIIGCGGSAVILESPEITMVVMHETSVTVTWAVDTSIENHGDFQGYNVYVYPDSSELLVEDGEDLNKHNADVITDNFYEAANLNQDSVYYIQVRTINIDNKVGDYTDSVPFVKASPRPEFTVTLMFEMNYSGVDDSCAIRFSDATIMADSAMPNNGADMWVTYPYGTPTRDGSCDFISPHLHYEYGTNSRITNFVNLGQYQFDDISEVTTEPTENSVLFVIEGDLVIAKTQDGNYVKIHVETIQATWWVTVTYSYQNIAEFPYF